MTSDAPPPRVRSRAIGEGDIDAVVALLSRGFPSRPRHYWSQGFRRQAERATLPGAPRFGLMLESEGRVVGAVLLFSSDAMVEGERRRRCNLSSWYVEPAFRMHASMLIFMAVRQRDATYVNISPAPHTIPTIEAQGFQRYVAGTFVGVPSWRRGMPDAKIHRVMAGEASAAFMRLPERELLLDHAAMGCLSVVAEAPDGLHPFVFLPFRIRSGRIRPPMRQLIYCRDVEDYLRFSGVLGRYLLWRGSPLVVHDANGPETRLVGRYFPGIGQKFFRGPHPPRLGDLAYTERAIFGP